MVQELSGGAPEEEGKNLTSTLPLGGHIRDLISGLHPALLSGSATHDFIFLFCQLVSAAVREVIN